MVIIWWRAGRQDLRTPGRVSVLCQTYVEEQEGERYVRLFSSLLFLTSLLVDAQLRNASARTPSSQLGHLIHKHSQRIILLPQCQYSTEVLRQALQSSDILANKFRRAVVVINDSKNAIHGSMVRLQ